MGRQEGLSYPYTIGLRWGWMPSIHIQEGETDIRIQGDMYSPCLHSLFPERKEWL